MNIKHVVLLVEALCLHVRHLCHVKTSMSGWPCKFELIGPSQVAPVGNSSNNYVHLALPKAGLPARCSVSYVGTRFFFRELWNNTSASISQFQSSSLIVALTEHAAITNRRWELLKCHYSLQVETSIAGTVENCGNQLAGWLKIQTTTKAG